MKLDQEILNVLMAAGSKGLKMEKIARHVYNACNSIFTPLNFRDVHAYVTQYLTRCAKDPHSVVEKGKGYGVYRINFDSKTVQQLMLNFSSAVAEEVGGVGKKAPENKQQALFGDEMFEKE